MKWAPIKSRDCKDVYAWKSDVGNYTVSLAYVAGEKKYRAWHENQPLHPGTKSTPKEAQAVCEKHFEEQSK